MSHPDPNSDPNSDPDPHCPECGEPIGQRATYCMHCSADLTEERAAADADGDGDWDDGVDRDAGTGSTTSATATGSAPSRSSADTVAASAEDGADQLLDPDGLADNALTIVVGIVGGLLVGLFGTIFLAALTASGWAILLGIVGWLGVTAHLVRRRTVQGAVAHSGYGIALVLLAIPLLAFSPVVDVEGGLAGRGTGFLVFLLMVAVPAGVAAGIGWFASQYVPEDSGDGVR